MNNYTLHERILEQKDWALPIFVLILTFIAIVKTNFENRFYDFMRVFVSDKYIKIYKDGSLIMSWFTVILFFVQMLSFSFFAFLVLRSFELISKTDTFYIVFIQLLTFFIVFVLAKFLLEKIIATTFDEEDLVEQFNMLKINYRTYFGVLLVPVNLFIFYTNLTQLSILYCVIFVLLVLNLLTYLKSIKIYQSLIRSHLVYFILYLCTLEIAPYYFIYYWFSGA